MGLPVGLGRPRDGGHAGCGGRRRTQRRKARGQTGHDELVEALRPFEILQPVLAEVAQLEALEPIAADERRRRLREHDLSAVCGGADPRRAEHV